jgi:hypothetical protein
MVATMGLQGRKPKPFCSLSIGWFMEVVSCVTGAYIII